MSLYQNLTPLCLIVKQEQTASGVPQKLVAGPSEKEASLAYQPNTTQEEVEDKSSRRGRRKLDEEKECMAPWGVVCSFRIQRKTDDRTKRRSTDRS